MILTELAERRVKNFATAPFDERKWCLARGLDEDLNAQRVDVRSFQTVTDGLAELRAAHGTNLRMTRKDDKLKAS